MARFYKTNYTWWLSRIARLRREAELDQAYKKAFKLLNTTEDEIVKQEMTIQIKLINMELQDMWEQDSFLQQDGNKTGGKNERNGKDGAYRQGNLFRKRKPKEKADANDDS